MKKAQRGTRQEQLQAAYEMWQKAKAGVEIAEKSYNRVNRLFEQGVMSAQKRDEAKAQFDAMTATEKAKHAPNTKWQRTVHNVKTKQRRSPSRTCQRCCSRSFLLHRRNDTDRVS